MSFCKVEVYFCTSFFGNMNLEAAAYKLTTANFGFASVIGIAENINLLRIYSAECKSRVRIRRIFSSENLNDSVSIQKSSPRH